MKKSFPICNEAEFQEWLASVWEAERVRLREQSVGRGSELNCPGKTKYDRQSEEPNEST